MSSLQRIVFIGKDSIKSIGTLPAGVVFPLNTIHVDDMTLADIIQKEKIHKNVSYYKIDLINANTGTETVAYLMMFKFHGFGLDRKLEFMGKRYGFPRGFPIIYIPSTGYLHSFGFYPKFENDSRQEKVNKSIFADAKHISGSIKISGFLGQINPFIHNDTVYVFFTSKNSANYDTDEKTKPFVQGVHDIARQYISDSALIALAEMGAHVCGEFMANFDITHGQSLACTVEHPDGMNSMVCTMIGFGFSTVLQSQRTPTNKLIDYMNGIEINQICSQYNIPRVGQFTLIGTENIIPFMEKLEECRDQMTYSLLCQIFAEFNVSIFNACLTHDQIYNSDIIEGLVLNIDGKIVKYKFPGYTRRTMQCRTAIEKNMVDAELYKQIRNFVDIWVIHDQNKQEYIEKCIATMIMACDINISTHPLFSSFSPNTAVHIIASEIVDAMSREDVGALANIDQISQESNATQIVNVIIINGAIGNGKSTVMQKLVECIPDSEMIDGDSLVPVLGEKQSMALTLTCGQERNVYTQWLLLKSLLNGKIPIISTGGGVFCDKGTCIIRSLVKNAFNLNVNLIQIVVDGTHEIVKIAEPDFDFYESSETNASVRDVVNRRLQLDHWTLPKGTNKANFIEKISQISVGNKQFTEYIFDSAACCWKFPQITHDKRDVFLSSDLSEFLKELSQNMVTQTVPSTVSLSQIRILTLIESSNGNNMGHITVAYNQKPSSYTVDDLTQIENKMPIYRKIPGNKITINSPNKKNLVIVVPETHVIHSDGSDHVTINSGVHKPSQMKTVAFMIRGNKNTVTLDTNTYNLQTKVINPCALINCGIFGIV